MREQELRIALVCFGGVSLAVYMHGISKEILKLVRASCALHAIADRQARMSAQFFDRFDPHDPEFDTEAVYFELLREIGRKLELRVIVDIIVGASAGGINGTILARAISHPYCEALALGYGCIMHQVRRDLPELRSMVGELRRLCDRYEFAYYREWALILDGWARDDASGADLARRGIANAFARHLL